MPTPQRTGDDEGRIVHGGELPEDDGSLDDVIVPNPVLRPQDPNAPKKRKKELWAVYFLRRLGDPKDYAQDLNFEVCGYLHMLEVYLKNGVTMKLQSILSKPGGRGRGKVIRMPDEPGVYAQEAEQIGFWKTTPSGGDIDAGQGYLQFLFCKDGSAIANLGFLKHSPELLEAVPIIQCYKHKQKYNGEQIITDLVGYVKHTASK